MAASITAREASRKTADVVATPVQTGIKINKGTLVSIDNTGFGRPARSGIATDVFAGVSYESADNTPGVAGAVRARIYKSGSFVFAKNAATAATDLGQKVYAADDQTLTLTATSNTFVGVVVSIVDAANLRIRIDQASQ